MKIWWIFGAVAQCSVKSEMLSPNGDDPTSLRMAVAISIPANSAGVIVVCTRLVQIDPNFILLRVPSVNRSGVKNNAPNTHQLRS